jgi:polygalacturonase
MRPGHVFTITDYGAISGGSALTNRLAIDSAITLCAAAGGGTVIIPDGDFKTYTIHLKSNVGIHFNSKNSIIRAAISGTGTGNDGGNYDAPEVNLWVGLQDEGHCHWANSLITGIGVSNIMFSGPGLIDGSYISSNGTLTAVLQTNDAGEVSTRTSAGSPGIANKAFGLKNDTNIIFRNITIKEGGHFAILVTGVVNLTLDSVLCDGNRDQIDIDCCQNVTVRNSVFNSPSDDALCPKASFALGRFMPCQNILMQNCRVSSYRAGSVIAGVYSISSIGTGRIKFGTEGTCGFNTITIQNCTFDYSMGFCIESVDGAEINNIIMDNCTIKHISYAPIFIMLGDRGRSPVTGNSTTNEAVNSSNDVRLDDPGFVLPNLAKYGSWPATRYIPSYTKNTTAPIGGGSNVTIVNQTAPTRLNAYSINPTDPLYANAVGPGFARIHNISISNVTIDDVDPRVPILIVGLPGHPIQNVTLKNITFTSRGGLKLQDAIEQRNGLTFGSNEIVLPRISWDATANSGAGGWTDDPYNIPETTRTYPEPNDFGILPAYGIFARHVTGLTVSNVAIHYVNEDGRPAVVLDDADSVAFQGFTADIKADSTVPVFVTVKDNFRRVSELEYVLNQPYTTTSVTNLTKPAGMSLQQVTINRPSPGTPPDIIYPYPTAPSATYPYTYTVANANYPRPPSLTQTFPLPLSVEKDSDPGVVPGRFELEQNYPNPFNPSTSFTYELSKAGFVSVKIYDLLGREVATLANEFKQAGVYSATWNAASFGSGVYFCKMQSGSFTATRKVVLMK